MSKHLLEQLDRKLQIARAFSQIVKFLLNARDIVEDGQDVNFLFHFNMIFINQTYQDS